MRNTCLNMVHELAKRDPRPVFIGSDLSPGLLDAMSDTECARKMGNAKARLLRQCQVQSPVPPPFR